MRVRALVKKKEVRYEKIARSRLEETQGHLKLTEMISKSFQTCESKVTQVHPDPSRPSVPFRI